MGRDFQCEMRGHFSPGPQYALPSMIGGAPANRFALDVELKHNRNHYVKTSPVHGSATVSLDATALGAEPCFSLTKGSFCDPLRALEADKTSDATYWRQATMLQPNERSVTTPFHTFSRPKEVTYQQMPWTEQSRGGSCYGTIVQEEELTSLGVRGRKGRATPFRNLPDLMSDPPLANNFGSLKSHADYGTVKKLGGLNRAWRESKVVGNDSVGTYFGPPPQSGKLRYAFIQHMGANSIPRCAPHADFEGGRITQYTVQRPGSPSTLGTDSVTL